MKNTKSTAVLALISWLWLACEDPLEPAQRIEQARVLGVRVSTERDAATLVPGESAQAELLLAGPEGPEAGRVAYRWCQAASSERGVPYCVATPWLEGAADASAGAVAVDVPASLKAGTRLALLGAACVRGEALLADRPLDYRCAGGEAPLRFSFDAWTLDKEPDFNPDLTGLQITLGGDRVALSDAGAAPTCEKGTPALEAGQAYLLEIELGGAALTGKKELQLSHFATRGELERQYSFASKQQGSQLALSWQAPSEPGPLKQYLVARDGSGGVSWATWNVCVRP